MPPLANFEDMEQKGQNPRLNITDNQAMAPLKGYLAQKNCKRQFVEPPNHRVNATERAIQTRKAQVGTMSDNLDHRLHARTEPTHAIMTWLCEYATVLDRPGEMVFSTSEGIIVDTRLVPPKNIETIALAELQKATLESWAAKNLKGEIKRPFIISFVAVRNDKLTTC